MARKKFYKSELTVSCESNARNKNLMGVLISILVLIAISSMIVLAIVVVNPDIVSQSGRNFQPNEAITLEEAMLNELSPASFSFQWLTSSSSFSNQQDELLFEDSKNIQIMSLPLADDTNNTNNNSERMTSSRTMFNSKFANGFRPNITTLVSNTSLISSIDYQGFKLSPSKRYLLIWTARRKQFRHSFTAKYFIYDLKLDLISLLSTRSSTPTPTPNSPATVETTATAEETPIAQQTNTNQFEHLDAANEYLNSRSDGDKLSRFQLVDWFQASGEDSLILIQDNDIYLLNNVGKNVSDSVPVRLTFTGQQEAIFNGIPDWLYEEEILSNYPAFQVSPKANSLAYMSFNDSQVDLMPLSIYGPSEQVYPRVQQIRYPKSGRANPRVTIHLVDQLTGSSATNLRHLELSLPDDLAQQQHYIYKINWLGDDKLTMVWINRNQNDSYIVLCSRKFDWKCEKNLHLQSKDGWLDLSDLEPILLDDDHYLALILKPEGDDVGEFRHLAKVSINRQDTFSYITGGRREVTAINGLDKKNGLLYYTSSVDNEPGHRQVFAHNLQTGNEVCLTCDLYPSGECLMNSASVSVSGKYFVFDCEGPGVPRTELRSIDAILNRHKGTIGSDGHKLISARAAEFSPEVSSSSQVYQKLINNNNSKDFDQEVKLTNNVDELGTTTATTTTTASTTTTTTTQTSSSNKNNQAKCYQNNNLDDPSLLWMIEANNELRDKLQNIKAMPLTMRLKVPIPNTNYSANVLLLLPPQLGGPGSTQVTGSKTASSSSSSTRSAQRLPLASAASSRTKRASLIGSRRSSSNQLERPVGAYFTPNDIGDYTDQLSSGQQYPMVVDVYAGPGSQKVDYRFHIGFGHYLASNRRTIYAMIDGRGSGFQGTKRLYELYHRLGTVEIQDQIEVASWLTRTYTFIDPGKVAIWGWSYGGYAAAMALAQSNARVLRDFRTRIHHHLRSTTNSSSSSRNLLLDPNSGPLSSMTSSLLPMDSVFECAASVAPVTNWIYYDTAYTERYMSSPYVNNLYDENSSGDHNKLTITVNQTHQQLSRNRHLENTWIPLSNMTNTAAELSSSQQSLSPLAGLIHSSSSSLSSYSSWLVANKKPTIDLSEHYMKASLIDQIANIDRRRFLLIHGTADDNVHFQQSIFLMKKLIQKNVMFETRLYPDQDHGIANKADKLHLGSTLSNFFAECFDMAYN